MLSHLRRESDSTQHEQPRRTQPNHTGIPNALKEQFETRSGLSMDGVRVHYRSPKPAQLDALAYTQGNHIHLGMGQERHLPHELGHVIQQRRGTVRPTATIHGVAVNTSPALEREADSFAKGQVPVQRFAGNHSAQVVQLMRKNPGSASEEWDLIVRPMKAQDKISVRKAGVQWDGKTDAIVTAQGGLKLPEEPAPPVPDPVASAVVADNAEDTDESNNDDLFAVFANYKEPKSVDFVELGKREKRLHESMDAADLCILERTKDCEIPFKKLESFYQAITDHMDEPYYWINLTTYATGDLTSVSAYVNYIGNHGIAMSWVQIGSMDKAANMNILVQFLGGKFDEQGEELYVITDEGAKGKWGQSSLQVLVDNQASPSSAPKPGAGAPNSKGSSNKGAKDGKVGLTDATRLIAETWNEQSLKRVRRAWGVEDDAGQLPHEHEIGEWLQIERGISPQAVIWGKQVVVLWIRKSGERGGAHFENDTSFKLLSKQIAAYKNTTVILTGDEKTDSGGRKKAHALQNIQANVYDLTQFWTSGTELLRSWGGNTRTGQFRLFEYINRHAMKLRHVGAMSGNLEAMALIGHDTEVHAGSETAPGVKRMLVYTKKDQPASSAGAANSVESANRAESASSAGPENSIQPPNNEQQAVTSEIRYNFTFNTPNPTTNEPYEKKAAAYYMRLKQVSGVLYTLIKNDVEIRVNVEIGVQNTLAHIKQMRATAYAAEMNGLRMQLGQIETEKSDLVNPISSQESNLRDKGSGQKPDAILESAQEKIKARIEVLSREYEALKQDTPLFGKIAKSPPPPQKNKGKQNGGEQAAETSGTTGQSDSQNAAINQTTETKSLQQEVSDFWNIQEKVRLLLITGIIKKMSFEDINHAIQSLASRSRNEDGLETLYNQMKVCVERMIQLIPVIYEDLINKTPPEGQLMDKQKEQLFDHILIEAAKIMSKQNRK